MTGVLGGLLAAAPAELGPFEGALLRLLDGHDGGVLLTVGVTALAVLLGAGHALGPGHGKTIVAGYLVAGHGRARHAVALGVIVAAMHAASVAVLGLGLHALVRSPAVGARVSAWMTLAAAALVLGVGAGLLARQLRRAPHGHHHRPLPPGASPLSARGIALVGLAGGLIPSPAAFLVLATAVFSGRTAFGLALVAAFSVGLAATLTVIGLAVLRGRDALLARAERSPRLWRVSRALPWLSATAILLGGAYLTSVALRGL